MPHHEILREPRDGHLRNGIRRSKWALLCVSWIVFVACEDSGQAGLFTTPWRHSILMP